MIRAYALVTAAYWGFTLTDGALRMLVLLHFYTLGFSPFQLAFLFVLYEFFGVLTNLFGGWIAGRVGLNATLYGGLALQIVALTALAFVDPDWAMSLSVAYVVAAQGLAGIAKDLTKMSAKSTIKLVLPKDAHGALFRWVAVLTGSKNALKGVGFFLGGFLLSTVGFTAALLGMAAALAVLLGLIALALPSGLGRTKAKLPFKQLLSKSREINLLSGARFFLFGARDVWFVVGVPVFAYDVLGWSFTQVGTFLAAWVIGYGFVQAATPTLLRRSADGLSREVPAARWLALALGLLPLGMAALLTTAALDPGVIVIVGLGLFGVAFALNSSVHSYLILAYTEAEHVTANVGFYYMANAGGRLVGSLLSGLTYQLYGLNGCLLTASAMITASWLIALSLPTQGARAAPMPRQA